MNDIILCLILFITVYFTPLVLWSDLNRKSSSQEITDATDNPPPASSDK